MEFIKKDIKKSSQRIRYSFMKILTGSDLSRRRLPFMTIKSANPGPVVWFAGCVHGDEVGGIVVIQEIFKRIRKKPLLKGSINAFPLMNPVGFETLSRNIGLTEEDLNRSFPGNKVGSLAERIADKIFTTIKQTNPTLVLDLHNDWRKSIPYIFIDPYPGSEHREVYEKTKNFSKEAGFLVVLDSDESMEKSLTGSLLYCNIPALTLELGESEIVNESNIEFGIKSIWNILVYLGMTEPIGEPFSYPMPDGFKGEVLKHCQQPLSSTSGIIRFLVKAGNAVRKNQPVARIYNTFGKLQETIIAFDDGIVLGHTDSSAVFPGMPVISLGII